MSSPEDQSANRDTAAQQDRLIDAMTQALASVAEPGETGLHLRRIASYVQALARQLCLSESYATRWPEAVRADIVRACVLHDIGNSAVPDRILLKPGALTTDELDTVRSHATVGRDFLAQLQRNFGEPSPFLDIARQIAYSHHERWDGKGYPQGLAGDAIPAPALLTAVADSYDALTSDRVYRAGIAHDKAIQQLFQERGAQLAPEMVDALIEVEHEFADIAKRFADSEHDLQRRIDYLAKAIAENP
ncbi:MAG: HD domain-containing phosphohydrolase [Burkholderiaceae bacterium]